MADDRPEDIETAADLGRPKRAPPTIDLEAEVIGEADTRVIGETESKASAAANEAGESAINGTDEKAGADAMPGETPPDARPRPQWVASALIPAISGAVAAGLVVAILSLLGWPGEAAPPATTMPQVDHAAVDALVARVANIESRAATPSAAPASAVAARIDALEKSIASLREELGASRSGSERLVAAVNELKAAPRDASPPPDLSAINERLAQIERTTRAQIAETAQQSAKPADDKALRRVVAATLLDVSVRHGDPYAAALDAAKALAPDAAVLKPLDPFAATGVPNAGALSRDLLALLPKPAPAPEAATTGAGIVDRLQAGAARLVRIQRTDAADSSDRSSIIIRAAGAAQRGDIAGARRELNTLPAADRAAVQPGIDRLDARDAALAASRQFAADAMAALPKTAP